MELPGVRFRQYLKTAIDSIRKYRNLSDMSPREFTDLYDKNLELLKMDKDLVKRSVNDGFSGGEKKRNEILQMAILEPEVAILDETDSGLDIDALGVVADGVAKVREKNSDLGVLTITHYQRLLEYLNPDLVHVIMDGRIVATGGNEIVEKLESSGYESFRNGDS